MSKGVPTVNTFRCITLRHEVKLVFVSSSFVLPLSFSSKHTCYLVLVSLFLVYTVFSNMFGFTYADVSK